jgi:hypothetical protein
MPNFIQTFQTVTAQVPVLLLISVFALAWISIVLVGVFEALRNQPKYQRTYRHFDPSYYRR